MSLLRFEGTSDRGPSGKLWNSLVDWQTGSAKIAFGCEDCDDFFPYTGPDATADGKAGGFLLSADTGSAAATAAVPYGVVAFAATAGTFAVAGYAKDEYVDLTSIKEVVTEARVSRTAGATGSETTFVGFSDQAPEAVFHSDGTLDGGTSEETLGLRWNNDLTVDLVSVVAGTATVLDAAVATAVSNTGFHKFGLRVKRVDATHYSLFASVDGVVTQTNVANTAITQDAMRPVAVTTISATDAPTLLVDWHCTLDATPS